jgi:putative transposase
MMLRTFRYPLRPTKAQEVVLNDWLAHCCDLYNGALQHRRDAWRRRISVSRIDQQKELTQLRAADAEWAAIPAWVTRSALARLDRAFRAFFRRVNGGEAPGFPRFRRLDRYDTFDFGSDSRKAHIDGCRVLMPKLGLVKFHQYRPLRGDVRHVSVSRTARGWTISFVCDVGEAAAKVPVRSAIGIDVGLEAFATLSNGERVENPRFFRASEDVLARRQQSFARKQRGSSSRQRAKQIVARTHEHIRNQRLDFARKLACALYARFDLIAHEDLQISRMVHGNLGKSINDAAWGQFLVALQSKAENAGKWCVPVGPRGTSQTCPQCGTVAKKALEEREHRCSCGFVAHRDHAAALCILGRGLRPAPLAEVTVENAVVRP